MARPTAKDPVVGAVFIAPLEVDHARVDPRLAEFAPAPSLLLPFPSILVASRNDPYASAGYAKQLAAAWGSTFVDAGNAGNINGESGLGRWDEGREYVERLFDSKASDGTHAVPTSPAGINPTDRQHRRSDAIAQP